MEEKPEESASFCAQKLKALSDPTRLAVLQLLLERPRHVGELNEVLNLDQSLLSHHLRTLRDAGLVEGIRDGKAVLYRLIPGVEGTEAGKELDLGCCRLSFPSEE